jgi:hypothetical protein
MFSYQLIIKKMPQSKLNILQRIRPELVLRDSGSLFVHPEKSFALDLLIEIRASK